LAIKQRGSHFGTIEATEAELQMVLHILTEHYFQNALKNGRGTGNGAYERKGNTLRMMVASMPKVSF
jgi:hypothetical protein